MRDNYTQLIRCNWTSRGVRVGVNTWRNDVCHFSKKQSRRELRSINNFLGKVELMEVVVDIIFNKEKCLVSCFYWSKVEKSSKTEATRQKILIEKNLYFKTHLKSNMYIIKERRLQEIDTNDMFSLIVFQIIQSCPWHSTDIHIETKSFCWQWDL